MNKKFFAFLSTFALILSALSVSFAQPKRQFVKTTASQTNALAALLPASDGVINVDLKRLMNEALPQILATNPEILSEINTKIAEVQTKTGLDMRQFEQLAVGVAFKQVSDQEVDFAPLILARGKFNAGGLLALAKVAAKGKYREEKVGEKTVYVFSAREIIQDNKPQIANSTLGKWLDKALNSLKNEIAVTTYDDNTLVIGTLERVTETFTKTTRINASVLAFINRKPNAVLSFGGSTANGLKPFFSLGKFDNDETAKILGGVRSVYGSLDVASGNVVVSVAAKSVDAKNAEDLELSLSGLQMIGKGFLGGAKGADKEVYARMIENARISRKASEVTLDLQVPQTDINILLGKK